MCVHVCIRGVLQWGRRTLCSRGHMAASHRASGVRRRSTARRRVMATVAGRSAKTCAGVGGRVSDNVNERAGE